MIKVLFVCAGNICRSPALMAAFKRVVDEHGGNYLVDSCGLDDWFVGADVDPRMVTCGMHYDLKIEHKAKLFELSFFDDFDYILVVNEELLNHLKSLAPEGYDHLFLATHFSRRFKDKNIPDPYYRRTGGFDEVIDMCIDAAEGLYTFLEKRS